MAFFDTKKAKAIDLLSGIEERKTEPDPRSKLNPVNRLLTNPSVSKAIDFLSGGKSPEEAEKGAYESVKRWAEIPSQVTDVGKFLTRPLIPPSMGGRPNTFTDFSDAAQKALGVVAAPFIPAAGAITSAVHAPEKTIPGILQAAMKGGIYPESAPSLFHRIDIAGIGTDTPLTEFERGGKTKIGSVARMIPRATMQALEMTTLAFMLGVPRATKKAITGRIKELKTKGMERDFNKMMEKDFSSDLIMTELQKQGILPRKAKLTPKKAAEFKQIIEEKIEVTKALMKEDPRVGEYFAKKQTAPKLAGEFIETLGEKGEAKISRTRVEAGKLMKKKQHPLIKEAKKYKTAEEWVTSQKPMKISVKNILPTEGHKPGRIPREEISDDPIRVEINKEGNIQIQDGNSRYFKALEKGDKTVDVVFNDQAPLLNFEGEFDRIESVWNQAHKIAPEKPIEARPQEVIEEVKPIEAEKPIEAAVAQPPVKPPKPVAKAPEPPEEPFAKRVQKEPSKPKEIKDALTKAGGREEVADLETAFESQKDIWLGNQDVRITLEIPAEKKNLQTSIRSETGAKKYGEVEKTNDMAVQLYIDNKRNPEAVKKAYPKLSDEQKKLIDASNNISDGLKSVVDDVQKSYKNIGEEALDAEVIRNLLDNYAARIVDLKSKQATEKFRKFGKTTRHAKERKFDTIAELWAAGFDLKVKGATNNLAIYKEELVKTIEDKKFIEGLKKVKDLEGNPLLTTKQLPGYKRVEHPNFTTWAHAGKATPGEVYGRNSFVSEEGDLFEKRELYAPGEQATNLNNILGISKLKGTLGGATDVATKYNAIFKAWVLQTSLFHHMAFGRSYYLGTNRKTFKEMDVIDSVNDGNRMIDEMAPVIVHGVRNGLTLGRKQDWQEDLLKEKTAIGDILDKWKVSKVTKDKILDFRQQQADFLFGVVGAGLKAKAYTIEYRNQSKKYPNENPDVLAKRVAALINDDFGGLHLKRLGRNPTTQHIFRLLVLAPDWTESNIRTMVIALTPKQVTWNPRTKGFNWTEKDKLDWRKDEQKMYSDFWAGILAKGVSATILANLASAAFDEDDVNGKGVLERFARNYKTAWNAGKYKWLDVDITPLYKAFGGTEEDRYYFSILGHFKDPFKLSIRNDAAKRGQRGATFKLGNTRAMKHKSSIVGSMLLDYTSGTDYAERRFTDVKELIGKDVEKGEYKTTRKGKYKKGDPKWGKLKGQTVTWDWGKSGSVELEQMPSFLLNKIRNTQPIQVQQMLGYWAGELSGFMAIGNALGLGIRKTYSKEPEQMSKKAWRKVPLNDKKVYKGKKYIKDQGLWREILIKGKSRKSSKPDDKTDKKKGAFKNRISKDTWSKIDALIAN